MIVPNRASGYSYPLFQPGPTLFALSPDRVFVVGLAIRVHQRRALPLFDSGAVATKSPVFEDPRMGDGVRASAARRLWVDTLTGPVAAASREA